MSDHPETIMLVCLRRIDQRSERMEDVRDIKRRLTSVEEGVGHLTTAYAGVQLRMDRMENRLDRIERRLDLHEVHR